MADGYHWVTLTLECGHKVTVSRPRMPKARKRCIECELIASFREESQENYDALCKCMRNVPMDDRADVIVQWIKQVRTAYGMVERGVEGRHALDLAEMPSTYSLVDILMKEKESIE